MTRDKDETLVKVFFFFFLAHQAFIKEVFNHSSLLLTSKKHSKSLSPSCIMFNRSIFQSSSKSIAEYS